MPDLRALPWTENDVLVTLKEGRTQHMSGHITVEMMQRVSFLLQRPLIRIAKQAQRLSTRLNICTKHEIEAAFKCILSRSIAHSCAHACAKAVTLYSMSGDTLKQSKAARCGLHFSVGKFQRWMIQAQISTRVHEFAAIYLTACLETLVEEIVLGALAHEELGDRVWNLEVLQYGITQSAALWGLLQPYEHLVYGRTAYGIAALPEDYHDVKDGRERAYEQETLEECMLSTCFGSTQELGDLIYEVMTYWFTTTRQTTTAATKTANKTLASAVYWSTEALQTLQRFTACSDNPSGGNQTKGKCIQLATKKSYNLMPPLYGWVSTTLAFTQYRGCCMVTPCDVMRAADVLLPTQLCHSLKPESCNLPRSTSKTQSATELHRESVRDLLFRVACTGQHQMMAETLKSICTSDRELLNSYDEQGLTLLMKAVMQGNSEAVLCLINNSAFINAKIPFDMVLYPGIHPSSRGWSALHFAILFRHVSIAKQLLDRGSQVEGRIRTGEENVIVTPLQLACAAGDLDLASLLVEHGADPYLHTTPRNGVSFTYNRGGLSAFSVAAMHGRKELMKYLVRCPASHSAADNYIEDVRHESGPLQTGYLHKGRYHVYEEIPDSIYQTIDDNTVPSLPAHHKARPIPSNELVTRSCSELRLSCSSTDPFSHSSHSASHCCSSHQRDGIITSPSSSSSCCCSNNRSSVRDRLSKQQMRVLQDALYNAAECGYLDVVLELHKHGVTWTLLSWGRCLENAFDSGKHKMLELLLALFEQVYCADDVTEEFVQEVLPLMLDMLKLNKDGAMKLKLAKMLTCVFGKEPLPKLKRVEDSFYSIDPGYLYSPECADVKLLVEGRYIFAHKAVLMHSSPRFHKILHTQTNEQTLPVVQLNDIRFKILQYILHYLYHGCSETLNVESKDIFELHAACKYYKLEGLRRHCEIVCVNKMHLENCVMVYKNAKIHNALALMEYCEGYFVQNLSNLLAASDSFHKMLYSRKRQSYNVLGGMLACLTLKLNAKLENRRKLAPSARI